MGDRAPNKRNPRWIPSPPRTPTSRARSPRRYRAQVDRYLLWNEPNQQGWLQPQWQCTAPQLTAVAPHVYRSLVRAAAR